MRYLPGRCSRCAPPAHFSVDVAIDAAMPMWRLHGSDGHLYFVGIDGNIYIPSQLPIEPGTSIAQS